METYVYILLRIACIDRPLPMPFLPVSVLPDAVQNLRCLMPALTTTLKSYGLSCTSNSYCGCEPRSTSGSQPYASRHTTVREVCVTSKTC